MAADVDFFFDFIPAEFHNDDPDKKNLTESGWRISQMILADDSREWRIYITTPDAAQLLSASELCNHRSAARCDGQGEHNEKEATRHHSLADGNRR